MPPVPSVGNLVGQDAPPTVAFTLVSDGTTVFAYDVAGRLVSDGPDGGAVLGVCLPPAAAKGWTIQFRNDGNVFPWGSVPALPKGITGKLVIDLGGATVQLSANGPRFLDFNKIADHDTFQNIEIRDGVIDCNNVGGKHHVVLGSYINGTAQARINVQDVAVRRITTINVPVDPAAVIYRNNVYIIISQAAPSEGTQNWIKRVVVEDCKFFGGNIGVAYVAIVSAGGVTRGLNIVIDDNTICRCYHSLLSSPQGAIFNAAHYFIGSGGKGGGGLNRVQDCYGEFSGDVGVEIDAVNCVVENCTMVDVRNASFFHTTFNDPVAGPGQCEVDFKSCVAIQQTVFNSVCYSIATAGNSPANASAPGRVTIEDCKAYRLNPTVFTNSWAMLRTDNGNPPGTFDTYMAVERFAAICTGLNYVSASSAAESAINIQPTKGAYNQIVLKDITHALSGASSGGATLTLPSVAINGTNLDLEIDGVRVDLTGFTGLSGGSGSRLVHLGTDIATTLVRSALIRNLAWTSVGDMTGGIGINMNSANLTIAAGQYVYVTECDFSKAASLTAATAVNASATNKSKTRASRIVWKTNPAPSTLAGLVTATGKTLDVTWPVMAQFVPGSGAAITAIDVSTDGGTTYTNILTQASAAMPGGTSMVVGPLRGDSLIKATFTTTQPTINLIPVD